MKQNKLKTLALVLALALILTLAVGMLVACNPNDDNQNPPTGAAKLISETQFNALVGYLYTDDLNGNGEVSVSFTYYSEEGLKKMADEPDNPELFSAIKSGILQANINIESGTYDEETYSYSDEKSAQILYLSSPEEAEAALEIVQKENNGSKNHIKTIENIVVVESEEGLFEEHISKTAIPNTVSDVRKRIWKQVYDNMTKDYAGVSGEIGNAQITDENNQVQNSDGAYLYFLPAHGNCYTMLIFSNGYDEDYIKEEQNAWEKEKKIYTDDSYFDTTSEKGYVFQYMTYKPGFVYQDFESSDGSGTVTIIKNYYTLEDVTENVVVPAKLDGKDIKSVELYNFEAKNVTVSEGISRFYVRDVQGNNLINLTLPSTLKDLHLESGSLETLTLPSTAISAYLLCPSLKTINFDGNKADFEQLYNDRANSWCHVWIDDDDTTHQPIYKDITITVVCKDGNLTYPQK